VRKLHGEHEQQGDEREHDKRHPQAAALVMHVRSRCLADRAVTLCHRPRASSADQVFAAHLGLLRPGGYPVTSPMLDVPNQFPPYTGPRPNRDAWPPRQGRPHFVERRVMGL
jgi:hypothetical protein